MTNRIYPMISDKAKASEYQNKYGDETLLTAAGKGDYDAVRTLLQKMMTDAHITVANNDISPVYSQLPAEQQYQVNEALLEAAAGGQCHIVELFAQFGANVNVRDADDADNDTPIKLAVKEGHKNVAEYLLQFNIDDESKKEALLEAAYNESEEMVALLLNKGVDVDTRDSENKTPLMNAAYAGELNVIKALLKSNATVNAQDSLGNTPLMWLIRGYKEIANDIDDQVTGEIEKKKLS